MISHESTSAGQLAYLLWFPGWEISRRRRCCREGRRHFPRAFRNTLRQISLIGCKIFLKNGTLFQMASQRQPDAAEATHKPGRRLPNLPYHPNRCHFCAFDSASKAMPSRLEGVVVVHGILCVCRLGNLSFPGAFGCLVFLR